ncbi:retrovirus-related pol polyprotein from transposon tnt 1-94 [Lasius niger]|uniref:Retrovirus-related pol polyprotein from transposon tnt 1-94 n=1 Tax=Lasius niger TaxID=67767 RepID=A0A0J7JZN1_LASNI|nr:retrovirus-related pol polyprotein from transposon tnt 1-94 [Lasius niger]
MQAYLQSEDLWDCVEGDDEYINNTKKMTKARAKIILSVDKQNYSHIQGMTTPKEAWTKLTHTFEDCGLSRKVRLLRILTTSRLEDFSTAKGYVNRITDTAHRLKELDFEVKDELIAALLLSGLPDDYKPMIMGLEGSGIAITSDSVKIKILQDVKAPGESNVKGKETAFISKSTTKSATSDHKEQTKSKKCYVCGKIGHFAAKCRYKPNKKNNAGGHTSYSAFATLQGTTNKLEWYLDSCASAHMTGNKDWIRNAQVMSTTVTTASNEKLIAAAKGTVILNMKVNGEEDSIPVEEVLHVPNLTANLLSVSKIVEKGHTVTFRKEGCIIKDRTNKIKARAYLRGGVYIIDTKQKEAYATRTEILSKYGTTDSAIWTEKECHC